MDATGNEALAIDEEEAELEAAIEASLSERLPELQPCVVTPFAVETDSGEVWIVAQAQDVVLFISLESDRFGVGFLEKRFDLCDAQEYPTAELAAVAFRAALSHARNASYLNE